MTEEKYEINKDEWDIPEGSDNAKTLDELLDEVSYSYLNSSEYLPSEFALQFMNFIKLVNGKEGESHKTPPVHLAMLDKMATPEKRIVNLLFRGAAKALDVNTRLMTPTGFVTMGDIQEGDTVLDRNGKRTKVTHVSDIYENQCYEFVLSNGSSFIANEDHIHIVKRRTQNKERKNIWIEENKTTKEILESPWYNRKVTDRNPSERETKWFIPIVGGVADFEKKDLPVCPYTLGILLGDGNFSVESQPTLTTHVDDLDHYLRNIPYGIGNIHTDSRNKNTRSFRVLETNSLLRNLGINNTRKYVPDEYLFSTKEDRVALLRGLMDTDGTIDSKGYSSFTSTNWSLVHAVQHLVSTLGGYYKTKRYENSYKGYWNVTIHLTEINPFSLHRKAEIWEKSVGVMSEPHYGIVDIKPVDRIQSKCISVDSPTESYIIENGIITHNTTVFMEYMVLYLAVFEELPHMGKIWGMIYVSDSVDNGVKNARQNIQFRYENSEFLQEWIPQAKFTDKYLEFTNKSGKKLGVKLYGASTGIRGSKVFGKRPTLAILDDLIGDADAVSKATMDAIKDTVYRGVLQALDPVDRKIVFNGTPFNKEDVIVEAVESGAWSVNVYPVAEKFPCSREEFRGAWEDRFSYDTLMDEYKFYRQQGKLGDFYQELMLRITNADERLVTDGDIQWYDSEALMENRGHFNFYITTDFATTARQSSDYTVISVWAHNSNGDWFWVDGFADRITMDITMRELFRLVQEYEPLSVGIESNGQQGGFISWIQSEMMNKNVWFTLAGSGTGVGIRRSSDKLTNFNYIVPLFKQKKFYFPIDKAHTQPMRIFKEQISLALKTGFKGKDDFLDTVSMLPFLDAIRPGKGIEARRDSSGIWSVPQVESITTLSSYIV